jgi:hypothetical protein
VPAATSISVPSGAVKWLALSSSTAGESGVAHPMPVKRRLTTRHVRVADSGLIMDVLSLRLSVMI